MSKISKVSILGDGGWGTTLAILLHNKGLSVSIWSAFPEYAQQLALKRENSRFLPGIKIPDDIEITSELDAAFSNAQVLIIAVPTQFLRDVLCRVKTSSFKAVDLIVSATKGIEHKTFNRPSEIITQELGISNVAVLSGPTIAREIAQGLPASCVVATDDENNAQFVQELFMSETFRVYTVSDVIGVEMGGALKNIMAIAAGISDGLGFGTNAKSALFTRGLLEMKRIGTSLGAKEETFNGLSGLGDLLTTCISPLSRNRYVGQEIAKGKPLADVLKDMCMVAEGVETARSVYELAKNLDLVLPITEQVYKVLFENRDPLEAVQQLMTRTKKSE